MVDIHRDTSPAPPPAATHTCGFCGAEFTESREQAACQACPLGKTCGYVRCPHCGYENPRSPGWLDRVREWIAR